MRTAMCVPVACAHMPRWRRRWSALYFAGEATVDDGYNATVEGAVRSGRRAAQELLMADGRSRES
ncbi:MAG TPA: FAD-dependent oxidoreductase [Flavobacteriales bacterium]|nr:FAD-dependent oxidoreductase [Flavobacteriales bacterium]